MQAAVRGVELHLVGLPPHLLRSGLAMSRAWSVCCESSCEPLTATQMKIWSALVVFVVATAVSCSLSFRFCGRQLHLACMADRDSLLLTCNNKVVPDHMFRLLTNRYDMLYIVHKQFLTTVSSRHFLRFSFCVAGAMALRFCEVLGPHGGEAIQVFTFICELKAANAHRLVRLQDRYGV
jgi:hypothetical protein